MLLTVLLVLLILALFGGGTFYDGGVYRNQGFGIGGVLVVILIVLLVMGRL